MTDQDLTATSRRKVTTKSYDTAGPTGRKHWWVATDDLASIPLPEANASINQAIASRLGNVADTGKTRQSG